MNTTGIALNFDVDYFAHISFHTSKCIKIKCVTLNEITALNMFYCYVSRIAFSENDDEVNEVGF
jgi:hypothetical protein